MRKRSTYRPRGAHMPMIVAMQTIPELGITERLSVEAFRGGWATTDHFDNLADCRDLLALANRERCDPSAEAACEVGLHALLAIKERHALKGRMGVTGDELAAITLLVDASEEFWLRQSGAVFERHYKALKAARKKQAVTS